jgi:tetratricopeptide (TPR) repeat protein
MFLNKRYAQASVAFLRARRNREADICDAYLSREKARAISTTTSAARILAFRAAANAFIECAQDSPSKQVNERLAYYRTAGECYSEARDLKNAGDSYRLAEQYTAAVRSYREGLHVDEMVEVITQHRDAIDSRLLERLTRFAQMYYFKVFLCSPPVSDSP